MSTETSTPSNHSFGVYLPIAITFVIGCLLAMAVSTESVRLPYVWANVAAVYFVCNIPLGRLIATFLHAHLHWAFALGVGICGLFVGVLAVLFASQFPISGSWSSRSTLALLVATTSLLVSHIVLQIPTGHQRNDRQSNWLLAIISLVFATLVPALYLESRCEYERQHLTDLVTQYRLGPALVLADRLHAVSPRLEVNGIFVSQLATDLSAAVAEFESQLGEPLSIQSTPSERLERARHAAILGRVEEVKRILAPLVQAEVRSPQACNLLGFAYEGCEQWLPSRNWYSMAAESLSDADLPQDPGDLLQALMGIAYAERKLGNYRAAEIAYQRALELDDSADMHFLMAQFYEDGQQASKAQQHAELAMKMAPTRYEEAGRELIDQLETSNFGCLSVFLRRRSEARSPYFRYENP